jgi:hypothetical protein
MMSQWAANDIYVQAYWNVAGSLLINSAFTTSKFSFACAWTPSINTWYHIAFVRSATTRYIFIDGVSQSLTSDNNVAMPAIAGLLYIGQDKRNLFFLDGWLDEFRISDIDRWTSNFTPETIAYNEGTVASVSEISLSLTQPTPTIGLLSNITLIPDPLALGITAEATPHINSNVVHPDAVAMGLINADPAVESGQEVPVTEVSMAMSVFAPTIAILTETVITPDEVSMGITAEEAVGTPNYFFLDAPLPLLTLSASIVSGSSFQRPLPMLTLSAHCVVGFLTYTTQTLPMLTLNVRMGVKVQLGLPILTLVASATNTNGSTFTKPLPLLTLSASGKSQNRMTLATSLPMFTVDIVMTLGGVHTFESALPLLRLSAEGVNGNPPANMASNLPLVTLSASGYSDGNVTLATSLPMLVLDAFGTSHVNRII